MIVLSTPFWARTQKTTKVKRRTNPTFNGNSWLSEPKPAAGVLSQPAYAFRYGAAVFVVAFAAENWVAEP
jgi:hypothetical protein